MTVAQFWSIASPEIKIAKGGGKGSGKDKPTGGGSGGNKSRGGGGWSGRGGKGGWGKGGAGGGVPTDPHWDNVTLLMGFEGTDGDQTTVDESSFTRGVNVFGATEIDDAQKKFGTTSMRNPGGTAYVNCLDSTDLEVSNAEDITIEGWYRFNALGQTHALSDKRGGDGKGEHSLAIDTDNTLYLIAWESFNVSAMPVGTTPITTGRWYHIAATRASGLWRIFLDGILEGSDAEGLQPTSNTQILTIGYRFSGAKQFNGWCDEYRFTKGVARYTANFIPPTAAFPRS